MATKETTTKETKAKAVAAAKPAVKPAAKKKVAAVVAEERYAYAVGRRKTAVAQVRLYPSSKAEEAVVNGRPLKEYFATPALQAAALAPLVSAGLTEAFRVSVLVRGGGLNGQADAVKLGVARALIKHDEVLRPALKAAGLLTRDARAVERKKPGLHKARRAPQWAKR
jgi:small subunit ribosomal protein S9